MFGSVAQGKARATSDIDLLVVGSAPFAAVVEACHAGTARLGREVNPVVRHMKLGTSMSVRAQYQQAACKPVGARVKS